MEQGGPGGSCRGRVPEAQRVAYRQIYERDRHRCVSPVCCRRDVTPHHLRFRSQGGSDEDANVGSLCVWCHLRGIHEGRITAGPPAERIRWRIGAPELPGIEVLGRQKLG